MLEKMCTKNCLILGLAVILLSSCGPAARFMLNESESDMIAPGKIVFQNDSKKAETYLWEFGDGQTSESSNPSHRYYSSGTYEVVLTAKKGSKIDKKTKRIQIMAPTNCLVEISTPYGNMLVELSDLTPLHRDNFVKLVEEGFYDDLLFHRVINGFMIQGGDPDSKNARPNAGLGSGGPGHTVRAEFKNELVHIKGALAAARLSDAVNPAKESSGSQFYIVQGREVSEGDLMRIETSKGFHYTDDQKEMYLKEGGTPFLDKEYTVFGHVIEGLDVIDAIANQKTNAASRPIEDIKMTIKVVK